MLKMLMFDFKESEKKYFENNQISDLDITFYKNRLEESKSLNLKYGVLCKKLGILVAVFVVILLI